MDVIGHRTGPAGAVAIIALQAVSATSMTPMPIVETEVLTWENEVRAAQKDVDEDTYGKDLFDDGQYVAGTLFEMVKARVEWWLSGLE